MYYFSNTGFLQFMYPSKVFQLDQIQARLLSWLSVNPGQQTLASSHLVIAKVDPKAVWDQVSFLPLYKIDSLKESHI